MSQREDEIKTLVQQLVVHLATAFMEGREQASVQLPLFLGKPTAENMTVWLSPRLEQVVNLLADLSHDLAWVFASGRITPAVAKEVCRAAEHNAREWFDRAQRMHAVRAVADGAVRDVAAIKRRVGRCSTTQSDRRTLAEVTTRTLDEITLRVLSIDESDAEAFAAVTRDAVGVHDHLRRMMIEYACRYPDEEETVTDLETVSKP